MNISHSQKYSSQVVFTLVFLVSGMATSVVCCQEFDGQGTPSISIEMPDDGPLEPKMVSDDRAPVSNDEPYVEPSSSILTDELPPPREVADSGSSQDLGLNLGSRKSIAKVVGSLAIVIAVFLIFAKLLGKRATRRPGALPHEVVRIQGTVPMDKKRDLMLIQMGAKLLLVVKSEQGIAPLGEVDDPQQVEWMIRKCNGGKNTSSDLQNMLNQLMSSEDPANYQPVASRSAIRQPAGVADPARQPIWMSGGSVRKPGRALFEA